MSRALLMVVSGPAGSGKTTLCARLTEANPRAIRRVITCTTRAPRAGEAEGVDYYFLTRPEFEVQVAAGVFLEHALVHGNLYGPRLADVAKHLDAGLTRFSTSMFKVQPRFAPWERPTLGWPRRS